MSQDNRAYLIKKDNRTYTSKARLKDNTVIHCVGGRVERMFNKMRKKKQRLRFVLDI